MPTFSYTATTQDGRTLHGTTTAASKEAVMSALSRQNLHPVLIQLKDNKGGDLSQSKFFQPRVKLKEMVIFTRQLSTMISAGVPLPRSLSTLQEQADSKYFKQVIGTITKDVEGGAPLGESFAKFPNVFSEVYINMVKAGEAGGILDEILKRLATQAEKDASMRKKIKSAMAYPVVILTITIFAFFGIMIFVIPKIGKIIKDLGGPDAQLPIYTQIMLSISTFMQKNAILTIALFAIIFFSIRHYIRTPKGKYNFHALLLRLPVISGIITKIAVARFARTFASLMGAGVSVLDALQVTGGAIGNKVIEKDLREAAQAVKNGRPLSESILKNHHFPAIVGQMLAVGEETGQIDTILVKVADFYEEEVETVIDGLSSLIEPLMIIVLGAIVGTIAASVMGPISSLSKNIGS